MSEWRFRNGWFGRLILQRKYWWADGYGSKDYVWEDASVEDLQDYYCALAVHNL